MLHLTAILLAITPGAAAMNLTNSSFAIDLGVSENGAPIIQALGWRGQPAPFLRAGANPPALDAWLPPALLEGLEGAPPLKWSHSTTSAFTTAEAIMELPGGLQVIWTVQTPQQGSFARMQVSMTNQGYAPRPIEWFPIWAGSWQLDDAQKLVAWRALSFRRLEKDITGGASVTWASHIHSSDTIEGGMNPYWALVTGHGRLYFSLDWCGGWQAGLQARPDALDFRIFLPPSETQLTLEPGESIAGPILTITAIPPSDDASARANWMTQRAALARTLYTGPAPAYPFTYNHWYTTRFSVDAAFLKRQIAAMDPYGFDAFIIDAGWYKACGEWTPDPAKFAPNEFEGLMKTIKDKGVTPGIWTCPQFVKAGKDNLPDTVDRPGMYRDFIDGWLLDYTKCDFTKLLLDHAALLRSRYHADWWKYDQDFFTEETRSGRMKNVVAFQEALLAVRQAQPGLILENCQSGGRMTNELTALATQSQWLRDGGGTGMEHARDNVSVALGALDFLFPWTSNRWTNNPDRMAEEGPAALQYYCRSAMPGTWGLVADLDKISDDQRAIILKERANYDRLTPLKRHYLYDLILPEPSAGLVGVVFYDASHKAAAALLFRWAAKGPIEQPIPLTKLQRDGAYAVEDVDTGQTTRVKGRKLAKGLTVSFPEDRLSALIFIDKAE